MTASGDFLSKDLFCQPQQQPDLLISRPLNEFFEPFSCVFHNFLHSSTKSPFIFRSYLQIASVNIWCYDLNIT